MKTRIVVYLTSLCCAGLAAAANPVEVKISLPSTALSVGQHYEVIVEHALIDGYANENIAPILQIDVPQSVTLDGEVLSSHKDLAKNEFLQAPFEVLLKDSSTTIGWTLTAPPTGAFNFNVLAFVKGPEGSRFVRQRFTLPLEPGATATVATTDSSAWGQDTTLQIGDKVPAVAVTTAKGEEINLGTWLGQRPIIVSTYRAFW